MVPSRWAPPAAPRRAAGTRGDALCWVSVGYSVRLRAAGGPVNEGVLLDTLEKRVFTNSPAAPWPRPPRRATDDGGDLASLAQGNGDISPLVPERGQVGVMALDPGSTPLAVGGEPR